ncbi:hypothetical protein C8Q70DRAFT_1055007 [Cubamyces menziesii]|nr:hypothetical protein C8Q70DRAFT_1055007 [Cubamyces menziesii]
MTAASAALVNRTIDDEFGDSTTGLVPAYGPDGGWIQGGKCNGRRFEPFPVELVNASEIQDGTWHGSTYNPGQPERTITATFTGRAVYVFNLIANFIRPTTTFTNLTFYIDGALAGNYSHTPDNDNGLLYHVPVFSTTLSHGPHTLVISAGGANASSILFDYIIYTQDDEVDLRFPTSKNGLQITSNNPLSNNYINKRPG